jgi:hypothetical protein
VRSGLRARSEYWSRADGDTVQSSSGKHQGAQLGGGGGESAVGGGLRAERRQKVGVAVGLPSSRRRGDGLCSMRYGASFFGRPHVSSCPRHSALRCPSRVSLLY